MSNQKRHQAGAPASQGGKFAPDHKPDSESELGTGEQPFRDLGVTSELMPKTSYDTEVPSDAKTIRTELGRQVHIAVEDGGIVVYAELIGDDGFTRFSTDHDPAGGRLTNGNAQALIDSALHDVAVAQSLEPRFEIGDKLEIREGSTALREDRHLVTELLISDDDGNWTQVEYLHDIDELRVLNLGLEDIDDVAKAAFLAAAKDELLPEDSSWEEIFAAHIQTLSTDSDVSPTVRAAARAIAERG